MDSRLLEIPNASPTETAFRHRGWMVDRARVRAAMAATHVPARRLERFNSCGAACTVEVAEDGSHHRLRAHYCGDRFCVPCGVARSHTTARRLTMMMGDHVNRFITLTLAPRDGGLQNSVTHLLESFSRLRECDLWKTAVKGGAYFIESTRGQDGGHWHVHVHVIVIGGYINQAQLSRVWKQCSKGSWIVDVRAIPENAKTARYVAKYAAKGFNQTVLEDPSLLQEAMVALRGRRLIGTFGAWRNLKLDEEEPNETRYKRLGPLTSIVNWAARGQAWAVGVLSSLGVRVVDDPSGRRFVDSG